MSEEQEHCARCHEGLYFKTAETDENYHLHCFHCDYHESRTQPGYHVQEPGAAITKIPEPAADPGGGA